MNIDIFTHAPPLGKNTRQVLIITHQAEGNFSHPREDFFFENLPQQNLVVAGGGTMKTE